MYYVSYVIALMHSALARLADILTSAHASIYVLHPPRVVTVRWRQVFGRPTVSIAAFISSTTLSPCESPSVQDGHRADSLH